MSYESDESTWTHLPSPTSQVNNTNFQSQPDRTSQNFDIFVSESERVPSLETQALWHQAIPQPLWTQSSALSPSGLQSTTSSATSVTASLPISERPSFGLENFPVMQAIKQESEVSGTSSFSLAKALEAASKSETTAPQEPVITAKQQEASQLIFSLSQSTTRSNLEGLSQSRIASLRIEERILNETLAAPAPRQTLSASAAQSIENVVNTVATAGFEVQYTPDKSDKTTTNSVDHAESPPRTGRGFLRAPGLGPIEPGENDETVYTCPVCSFCCRSKFHYNSHMNTHGDHRCSMCDYTSRTEGRLKKHMRESHTRDEQIAAGMDVPPKAPTSSDADMSATMASVIDLANRAVAAADSNSNNANPLDSIRQLTENGNVQVVNALNRLTQNGNGEGENEPPKSTNTRRASGKPKRYKCKNCEHVSPTKEDSWDHNRVHIPIDKQLTCPQCKFVTEYKHHLEYHIRNHYGSKPFKCAKCTYSCVNKSMLNSHMKSHSELYMFQCMDCNYQSKYCHSLKMHLQKYDHRRKPGVSVDIDDSAEAMANPEAIENPDTILKERNNSPSADTVIPSGPAPSASIKSLTPRISEITSTSSTILQNTVTPVTGISNLVLSSPSQYAMLRSHQQDQISELVLRAQAAQVTQIPTYNCTMCDFSTSASDQMVQHNVMHLQANAAAAAVSAVAQPPAQPTTSFTNIFHYITNLQHQQQQQHQQLSFTAQDVLLRVQQHQQQQQQQLALTHTPLAALPPPTSQPAVSPVVKMEVDVPSPLSPSPGDSSGDRSSSSPADGILNDNRSIGSNGSRKRKAMNSTRLEEITARLQGKSSPEDNGGLFTGASKFDAPIYLSHCQTCNMGFGDMALYTIHRGYHGFENPLKCNNCGKVFTTPLDFNLHLMQSPHG